MRQRNLLHYAKDFFTGWLFGKDTGNSANREPRKLSKSASLPGNAKKIFILKGDDSERVKVNDRSPLVNAIKNSVAVARSLPIASLRQKPL